MVSEHDLILRYDFFAATARSELAAGYAKAVVARFGGERLYAWRRSADDAKRLPSEPFQADPQLASIREVACVGFIGRDPDLCRGVMVWSIGLRQN
jgi:hypothetical protein